MGWKWHQGCWRSEEEAGEIDDENGLMMLTFAGVALGTYFIYCGVQYGSILGYCVGGGLLAICWRFILQIILFLLSVAAIIGIIAGIWYLVVKCGTPIK